MAKIKTLKNWNEDHTKRVPIAPRTHVKAVFDDDGNTLDSLMAVQDDKLSELGSEVRYLNVKGNGTYQENIVIDIAKGNTTTILTTNFNKGFEYSFNFTFTEITSEAYIGYYFPDGTKFANSQTINSSSLEKKVIYIPDNNYTGAYITISHYNKTVKGELLYTVKDTENKIHDVFITTKNDLIGITEKYSNSVGVRFVLSTDIDFSTTDEYAITLPESSIFDFNGHKITINNNSKVYFSSPFNYNDDGANFDRYPKLVYDRNIVPRPLYIRNNERWNRMPLRGMFRVNNDIVYLSDFYRGCVYNKALASFCRCKIILEDVTLNYNSSDADDAYAYGINSDVLLEGETSSVVTINESSIKLRVVGNNVVIKNLKIEHLNTTAVSEITVTPLNEFDVTNFKFIGNNGRIALRTTVRDGSKNKIKAIIKNNTLSGALTQLSLGYLINSEISGNNISNCNYGIILQSSRNNEIKQNSFYNIKYISVWVATSHKEGSYNNELAFGCYNNIIECNNINLNKEEALSVDGAGSEINVFTVNELIATDSHPNKVNGTFHFSDDIQQYYKNGCIMVALHKDRGLKYHIILDSVDNGDGTYTIEAPLDSFNNTEVGDRYMIISPTYNNVFRNNNVIDATTALCIYGSSFRNTFTNNTIISTGVLKANYQMYMMSLYNNSNIPPYKSYARPIIDNVFYGNTVVQNIASMSNTVGATISQKNIDSSSYADLAWDLATSRFIKGNKIINNSTSGNIIITGADETTVVGNTCPSVIVKDCNKTYLNQPDTGDYDKNGVKTKSYLVINNATPSLYYKIKGDASNYYRKIREASISINSEVTLTISRSNDSGKIVVPSVSITDVDGNLIDVTELGISGTTYTFKFIMPKRKCIATLSSIEAS